MWYRPAATVARYVPPSPVTALNRLLLSSSKSIFAPTIGVPLRSTRPLMGNVSANRRSARTSLCGATSTTTGRVDRYTPLPYVEAFSVTVPVGAFRIRYFPDSLDVLTEASPDDASTV